MSQPTIEVTATWRSTQTLEVPEGMDPQEATERINGGDLELLVELGDVDTATAELVDFSART